MCLTSHLHHIEGGGEEGGGPQPEEGPRVGGVAGVGDGQGRGGGGVGQRAQGVAGVVGVAEVGVAVGEAALGGLQHVQRRPHGVERGRDSEILACSRAAAAGGQALQHYQGEGGLQQCSGVVEMSISYMGHMRKSCYFYCRIF